MNRFPLQSGSQDGVAQPRHDAETFNGRPAAVGVEAQSVAVPRPAAGMMGDVVTVNLNLEPGTKYDITVIAINQGDIAISEAQANQDTVSATTLLSAPFFGAYEVYKDTANPAASRDRVIDAILADNLNLAASNFQGAHWFAYEGGSESWVPSHVSTWGTATPFRAAYAST